MVERVGAASAAPQGAQAPSRRADGSGAAGFEEALSRASELGLRFSSHAAKRMQQRGLQLDGDRLRRLEEAVDRAAAKGARESLVLLDELALVVSVRNQTVITAMDEESQREHVFTNIDSVVIAQ